MECIGKGKARTPYELGRKATVAGTNGCVPRVERLFFRQMHSTMTLKEEKVVVKEIELLKASRKQVGTGSWRLGMVVEQR